MYNHRGNYTGNYIALANLIREGAPPKIGPHRRWKWETWEESIVAGQDAASWCIQKTHVSLKTGLLSQFPPLRRVLAAFVPLRVWQSMTRSLGLCGEWHALLLSAMRFKFQRALFSFKRERERSPTMKLLFFCGPIIAPAYRREANSKQVVWLGGIAQVT